MNWTASTDNVGVANYVIEACSGAGCTGFTQLATSSATTYRAAGLVPGTTYRFRVRASDAAGNPSAYSPVASATTAAVPGTPKGVVFAASSDHETELVTGYRFEVFPGGADLSTGTPIATTDLGKPTPANGEITVDLTPFFAALARGSYQATVSAYGPGGRTRSEPVAFTR